MIKRSMMRGVTMSVPGRRGVNGVVAAGGSEMYGKTRGPVCTVPEPEESWLHVLGATLPFRDLIGVVTLDDGSVSNDMVDRAKGHFRQVMHLPLTKATPPSRAPPGEVSSSSSALMQLVSAGPYRSARPGELDGLCFAGRSFAAVLPWAAHHVTEASALLKPHGVLSIFCQRKGRLVGPKTLVEDWDNMVQHLVENFGEESTFAEETGFEFVQLPHLHHVTRRWLTSEYALTTTMLEAYVRSWPEYHRCATPRMQVSGEGEDVVLGKLCFPAEGDPLEAFLNAANAYLRATQPQGTRLGDVCRLAVDHCVITCDNRPSNRPPAVSTSNLRHTLAANMDKR